MAKIIISKLMEKVQSVYKLTNLATMRAHELSQGSQKLVEAEPHAKLSTIALQEIMEGKIVCVEKGKDLDLEKNKKSRRGRKETNKAG